MENFHLSLGLVQWAFRKHRQRNLPVFFMAVISSNSLGIRKKHFTGIGNKPTSSFSTSEIAVPHGCISNLWYETTDSYVLLLQKGIEDSSCWTAEVLTWWACFQYGHTFNMYDGKNWAAYSSIRKEAIVDNVPSI